MDQGIRHVHIVVVDSTVDVGRLKLHKMNFTLPWGMSSLACEGFTRVTATAVLSAHFVA